MARFPPLFCAILAAATSARAVAVVKRSSDLITFWTDINFSGNGITFVDDLPTGCIEATSPFIESVSSVSVAAGVRCTLWNQGNCGGEGLAVSGNVANLVNFGFNDAVCARLMHTEQEMTRGQDPSDGIIRLRR
ncbi:hypothetical protein B0H13DRAFT_1882334 [Mycena leptocephala]|nr:hypothetical protein B0H13DRAFT_1882334 [Mycena leptocephala]